MAVNENGLSEYTRVFTQVLVEPVLCLKYSGGDYRSGLVERVTNLSIFGKVPVSRSLPLTFSFTRSLICGFPLFSTVVGSFFLGVR